MIITIGGIGGVICIIQVILLMAIALGLELFHNRRVAVGNAAPKFAKDYEVEKTPLADHPELSSKNPASLRFRLTWDFTAIFRILIVVGLFVSMAVWIPVGNSLYQSIRTRDFPTADGIILPPLSADEDIAYQYRVNNRDYVETGAYFGNGLSQNRSIADTHAKYPPETAVRVYYNPDNVNDSALERPDSQHWRDNFAFGMVIFVVSAFIFGRRVWASGHPSKPSQNKRLTQ